MVVVESDYSVSSLSEIERKTERERDLTIQKNLLHFTFHMCMFLCVLIFVVI